MMKYLKFIILLFVTQLMAQNPVQKLFIPWGMTDEDVNFREEPGMKFGPQSFQVRDNSIFILDPVNKSIKKFTGQDYKTKQIAPGTAKDFALVTEQNVSFVVGNEIYEYSKDKLIEKHLNNQKFSSFEEVRLSNQGTAIKRSDNVWETIKYKVASLFKKSTMLPNYGSVKLTSKTSADIALKFENSTQIVTINHSQKNLASMRYLGFDNKERMYVDVNMIIQQVPLEIQREVWILNLSGEKIGVISIPDHYFTHINRDLQVTDDSKLYHMISSENGIYIYRWDIPEDLDSFHGDYPDMFKKKVNFETFQDSNEMILDFSSTKVTATITREKTLEIADTYVQHQWTCKSENLTNGTITAPDGYKIDTPNWIQVGDNQKIPYKWGGFNTLSEFDNGLQNNKYAGDTYTSKCCGSSYARGVDCSGYVSRCWQLSSHYATSMMNNPGYGSVALKYNSWDDLQPGDAILKSGSHVILFVKRNDNGSLSCLEAAASTTNWKVDYTTHYPNSLSGYSPVYYKNMEGAALASPKYITLESVSESSIEVSFSKVDKASEYVVYYGTDKSSLEDSVITTTTSVELSELTPLTPYFVKVKAQNETISSIISRHVYATIPSNSEKNILVINGFDRGTNTRQNYVQEYIAPILDSGYGFSYVRNESVTNSKISLLEYSTVIWILGDESTSDETFSNSEQDLVEQFLKKGGNLFVSGSEIGWDLDKKGSSADQNFYHNFLKAKYYTDAPYGKKAAYYTVESVGDGIFNSQSSFKFDDGSHGTIDVNWPDAIKPVNGSENCLKFKSVPTSDGVAGVQFSGKFPDGEIDGKLVYLTFPLETVYDDDVRIQLMETVLEFFDSPSTIEHDPMQITEYRLEQNYPNPFNPSTKIRYQLPETGFVEISLFDLTGRHIETLVNQQKNAGQYDITWNADHYSSGVYLYSISVFDGAKSRLKYQNSEKCILIK